MDDYHRNLERQLQDLRFKVHDSFDNINHPTARLISNELKNAEDAAQGNQNLRSIEDRLKVVQRQLQQSQQLNSQERFINPDHSDQFYHHLENMRMDMRRQPHY
ncbi:hypothetical protein KC968_00350 [Candidatus Saccharibacteria bacterium]|nr:hypothetical protein [Candidatus Saccharibacteria bacterium]